MGPLSEAGAGMLSELFSQHARSGALLSTLSEFERFGKPEISSRRPLRT